MYSGSDAMTCRGANALEDMDDVERWIEQRALEFQVGGDDAVWEVRVRGHDPTGAYHEESYRIPNDEPLTCAMREAAQRFCTVYGVS